MLFKFITAPWSNRTKQIEVVQTWEVRWTSRYGEYSYNTRPEIEVFSSEDSANEFATSLRNAFRLVKTTSGNSVKVTKG